jgi:ATP-dependent RNA helicase DDX5/DBP2
MGEDKAARKEALKAEAETLGITYDELKAQKKEAKEAKKSKKRSREAESLNADGDEGQKGEKNRMRSWSKDLTDKAPKKSAEEPSDKRRRTRSMDLKEEETPSSPKEEKKPKPSSTDPTEWRKENTITIQGHGKYKSQTEFPDPFFNFTDAPFCEPIQKALTSAGFAKPTSIQSQVCLPHYNYCFSKCIYSFSVNYLK